MKKTNRNSSLTMRNKNHIKPATEVKTSLIASKKNVKQKKNKNDAGQKENHSFLPEQKSFFKPITIKKAKVKKGKQRSKSLLCQKKDLTTNEMSLNQSSHRQALLQHLKLKFQKDETDITGNINSIRLDKSANNGDFSSHYLSPHPSKQKNIRTCYQLNDSIQPMAIHQQNDKKYGVLQEQKQCLLEEIAHLQAEIQEVRQNAKNKEEQLLFYHQNKNQELVCEIVGLKKQKQVLSQHKYDLQCLISEQNKQIQELIQSKCQLQIQLTQQVNSKVQLVMHNKQSQIKIKALEQQLFNFESNLSQFSKMRDNYEHRLHELQNQKKKIKTNACELLQMLQKYKQFEQNDE